MGHVGVGWVIQWWGGVGHGSYRGGVGHIGVGWVMQGWVGLNVNLLFPIHIQPFMNDSNSRNDNSMGLKIHEWIWQDVYEWGNVS